MVELDDEGVEAIVMAGLELEEDEELEEDLELLLEDKAVIELDEAAGLELLVEVVEELELEET